MQFKKNAKLRTLDLKEGMFRGMPIYVCTMILLTGILVLSVLYAVTVGSADLSVEQVYRVIAYEIFRYGDPEVWASGAVHDIVWVIRFPRIVLGVAVGMGLAVVGVVMQAIVKNPLADPYILGISSGASLGATLTILLGAGILSGVSIGMGAFAGAMIVSFAVIAISGIGGRITSVKLILSGVALSSICSAFSNFIVYIADDPERFRTVTFWLMGSLAGAKWDSSLRVLVIVICAILFFVTQSRMLNLMLMGDSTAITLGTNLQPFRKIYLIVASLMIGFIVYQSGVIGFVGLIIPHFVRGFFGVDHKKLLPLSALCGGIFLVWADVVSRTILPKTEIPIGILISVVGAPIFIILLIRKTYSFGGGNE
ncbi:MAG: iron chelate uptake ABC transporter family permease subunit [Lachnospiraceae bacterium]|nr:iron ABC transporter permease [Robinsoniella sp.]MDY3765480.1 iron chelate uptake ABC transporter family permease subunit [Lachnospiraceae bacterium]